MNVLQQSQIQAGAHMHRRSFIMCLYIFLCVCSCALGEDEKFFGLVTPLPLPVITPEPCNPWRMQMPPGEYYCS